jgi:two-component system response regulator FixJ
LFINWGFFLLSELHTIAIIDDDLDMREAVAGLLESIGYVVESFGSAEEFLSFPRRKQVDCAIIDIRMPGRNGLELQDVLTLQGPKPPIIFLSSQADEATRRRAALGGAFGFVGKPADDKLLIACIEVALKMPRP